MSETDELSTFDFSTSDAKSRQVLVLDLLECVKESRWEFLRSKSSVTSLRARKAGALFSALQLFSWEFTCTQWMQISSEASLTTSITTRDPQQRKKITQKINQPTNCEEINQDEIHTQPIANSNGEDISAWPVLVAVRCRPRKRQRTKDRFAAVHGEDKEIRRSGIRDSSDSSDVSSSSGERGSHSVQRGVFEYSACRDYHYSSTYDTKILPPRMQRPRRLYVQAPTTGNTSGRRSFDFDFIFPPWTKQREVYDKCVRTQIDHVLQSQQQGQVKHATILAYGQTGTGKTYTMGMLSDFTDDKEQGLIPRALSQILEFAGNVEGEEDMRKTVVTLSFLQIYLETIQDLLALPGCTARGKPYARHGTSSGGDLPVRQGRDGAFYVADLNEYEVSSIEDAHALLELAMRNRVLAATTKNKTSSRSHTLLTISIKRRRGTSRSRYSSSEEDEDQDESNYANDEGASTISFVDLAGSERVDGALHFLRATRARQEQRIREAKFINRSLSALGGVIAALAQPKPSATGSTSANVLARLSPCLQDKPQHSVGNEQGQPHIRFRDSQLTKLLQGRLMGGRGRLLLIATVDDQAKNLSETLSTLKFASQCRRVELQPGSRLRGDRGIRLRRQKALLDQVFNNMKMMHENREAALHSEYQARIEALERELETIRATTQSFTSSAPDDEAPTYLASYTALCSLVDTVSSIDDSENQSRESKHPKAIDFQSEKEMLEYVAGLYSRLKEALVTQQQPEKHVSGKSVSVDTAEAVVIAKVNLVPSQQPATRDQNHKQTVPREPLRASNPPADSTRASSMQLSPEHEAEFRDVARHLIATRALDSFVVSSSDEDD
ncbi:hypothetical protein PC113_g2347 [Phytophthora cactorum]|uniref:Kinesin-like protein n=1 Tax=Phytophthora cactorum TaxID=29920 RepID=A0A8T0ZU99_9STRA|nr:hypothetical protein PC113_g2347 [Phytophthora cactorum]KAG2932148.1 hypothetical protein PC114_g1879 [Phytophthora cactorum]KAG2941938.1 hypothetical protein PC115_g1662 [Phytophthora cactorum]KAG2952792.1 hypothetical protein PC117_g2497 [Phytophthora cactorum]